MEVNSATSQKTTKSKVEASKLSEQKKSKKLSKDEILAKVKGKFGAKAAPKKAPPKPKQDVAEISGKAKQKTDSAEQVSGDIQKNDPKSAVTQEKLKNILKTGAFNFSDKERQALSKILKM